MNPTDDKKFEQLSPVLELMYLMVSNMSRYLKVYAEDTDLTALQQYKDTLKALENLKNVLDGIYGIEDEADAEVLDQPTMSKPSTASPFADMRSAFDDVKTSTMPTADVAKSNPFEASLPQAPVVPPVSVMPQMPTQSAPMQAPVAPQPTAQQAPASSQSEIDSILGELRKLQSNSQPTN